jgi:RNA polymerase sigma factor (sigma-70 family)
MDEEKLITGITSDTLLWNNFCSGDDKSFENIYRTYVKTLFRYGSKFTNDKEFVIDCIQEVFVDIFIHRKNLGETNNIKLFLFLSLKRKLIHSLKKKGFVQFLPDEALPFLSIYSTEEEVSDQESDEVLLSKLSKALETLSPRQKEAIYLRFSCELQYEEICQIMELNNQSVRNLVHRAIEKLRKIMICIFFFTLLHQ